MQICALNLSFFGTGATAVPYSLCFIHRNGENPPSAFHTYLSPTRAPSAKELAKAGVSAETLEHAPSLRSVWEKIRESFTHSLILCKKDEASLLSTLLSESGIYPPVFFTLPMRDLYKLAGEKAPAVSPGEEGTHQLLAAFDRLKNTCAWETCISMIQPAPVRRVPKSLTFFDCETADSTGAICAIGLIHRDETGAETEYYTLINPERPMQKENLAIHGITDEMTATAPTFPEVWKEIRHFFTGSILVAHSAAAADLYFLRTTLINYKSVLGHLIPGEVPYICTCRAAQKLMPELDNHRLSTLCEHFSIPLDHHNAMSDTRGCMEIFDRLGGMERLSGFLSYSDLSKR